MLKTINTTIQINPHTKRQNKAHPAQSAGRGCKVITPCINNEKGVALVTAMFVMVLMTLLGVAALYTSTLNITISGNEKTGLQAYYAALAGIRDVEQRLVNNSADTRGGYVSTATPCPTPNTNTKCDPAWTKAIASGANALSTGGSYSVVITHVGNSTGTAVPLDANNYYPTYRISSTGNFGGSQRIVEKTINLTFSNLWNRAVTACGAFSVDSNSGTDSYSSTTGAYGGANVSNVGNVYTSGDVALNANTTMRGNISTTGNISADSNVQIGIAGSTNSLQAKGNISFGSNNTLIGSAKAGGTVTGSCGASCTTAFNDSTAQGLTAPPQCNAVNFLPIKASSGNNDNSAINVTCSGSCSAVCKQSSPTAICNVNSGDMTLAGGTADNPKRYYFNGLNINSNSNIKTTGYVEIYVNGDYHQDANTIVCGSGCNTSSRTAAQTSNPKPAEILVYVNGSATGTVCAAGQAACAKIDSNSDLYGKLYAPTSGSTNINSNAHVYGAVIAANICSNCNSGGIDSNAGVSFDSALSSAASQTASGSVTTNLRECYYGTYTTQPTPNSEYYTGSCKPR